MSFQLESLAGRTTTREDAVDAHRWGAYHAFFGLDPTSARPLAFHWLLFNDLPGPLRPDGHPVRMDPLPELPFGRRMWAGGEILWRDFLTPGVRLRRTSVIGRAELKTGRSGQFLLCSLEHAITAQGRALLQERQDLVFLPTESRPGAAATRAADFEPEWRQSTRAGSVKLFGYSALTLNEHRIHYDAPYTTGVEGYPGLLVHGPLLASQLMHAAAGRHGQQVPSRFSYRAIAPLYVDEPYQLVGRRGLAGEELAVLGPDGGLRMTAVMSFGTADSAASAADAAP